MAVRTSVSNTRGGTLYMAKSILDGTEWTATEFAGLLPEEQNATRQELACLSCDGRAVFRAGQQRQPSFAARHRQDCRLVSRPWSAFRFLAEAGRGT
ncbi:competence protein CoiA family protein [Paenarthrobacter sp. YJN-D]|uniref:competence protein CoiA family protein n=2 Tax=Paenarthrobacter TaxID=1742992 RepID=UPI001180E949